LASLTWLMPSILVLVKSVCLAPFSFIFFNIQCFHTKCGKIRLLAKGRHLGTIFDIWYLSFFKNCKNKKLCCILFYHLHSLQYSLSQLESSMSKFNADQFILELIYNESNHRGLIHCRSILTDIVVPELFCTICHVNSMQIPQDNSGTTIFRFLREFFLSMPITSAIHTV
jgi:hypothetical protein